MLDKSTIINGLVGLVSDDQVENLGSMVGEAIKSKVKEIVADTENTVDDTKAIAFLNGVAKGVLEDAE